MNERRKTELSLSLMVNVFAGSCHENLSDNQPKDDCHNVKRIKAIMACSSEGVTIVKN